MDDMRDGVAGLLADAPIVRASFLQASPGLKAPAARELEAARDELGSPRAVERLIRCADLWTLIAADQLRGMGALIRDGESVLATFPVARSVIEHSASVVWILDPEEGTKVRAIRAALATLRSDEEMAKAASRMGGRDSPERLFAKARFEQSRIEVAQDFASFDKSTSTIEGIALSGPTEIIEHFGNRWGDSRRWVGMYDYLCATATHPSLSTFEFIEPTATGSSLVMTADFLNRLVRGAFVPFAKALEHFAAYMGWNRSPIDGFFDKANLALGDVMRLEGG